MSTRRRVEIFSAGCPACEEMIQVVTDLACPSCEVSVLDMNQPDVATRAKSLGIRTVPAVAVDGTLAACCAGAGPDASTLQATGIGQPIS